MVEGWGSVPVWIWALAAMAITTIAATLLVWRTKLQQPPQGAYAVPTQPSEGRDAGQTAIQFLDPHQGALAACREIMGQLSFRDSIDHERFAAVVQESAKNLIESRLRLLNNGGNVAINSIQAQQHGELILTFSTKGQALLEAGQVAIARDSAGRLMPQLKAPNGKIEEMGRIVDASKAGKLANIGTAVVGAAHLIAGADVAKRLKSMDVKIDALLMSRRIDQFARLERIFIAAKERLASTNDVQLGRDLDQLRYELKELRIIWRHECDAKLRNVDGKKSRFTFQKTVNARVQAALTEADRNVYLIEYALRLDRMLASASGASEEFERVLFDELEELRHLQSLFEQKRSIIKESKVLSFQTTQTGIREVISAYRRMLPQTPPTPAPQKLTSA